jgi:hypothetical protein
MKWEEEQKERAEIAQRDKRRRELFAEFRPYLPDDFRIGQIDYNAVLIPSAPVPVGGSLLFVPVTSVRPAELSVDAFMSIYVSMGVTGPQFMKPVAAAPHIS